MRAARIAISIIGILLILVGLIWIGQGSGAFPYPASSFMINQTPWITRGAIVLLLGIIVLSTGRRFIR